MNDANKQTQTHLVVGLVVICIGLLVLILTRAFIRNHVPVATYFAPIFICIGLIWAATAVGNAFLSISFAVLALMAPLSYFTDIGLLRKAIGLACIALGFLLLYYIIFVALLNRKKKLKA
jgi:hypothetical protein